MYVDVYVDVCWYKRNRVSKMSAIHVTVYSCRPRSVIGYRNDQLETQWNGIRKCHRMEWRPVHIYTIFIWVKRDKHYVHTMRPIRDENGMKKLLFRFLFTRCDCRYDVVRYHHFPSQKMPFCKRHARDENVRHFGIVWLWTPKAKLHFLI
jgi:hypothetical protein